MKKFFVVTILTAVFFTGIGSMITETAAKYKSDEKALALLAKARQAIGGENNLAAINSMAITGRSTRIFTVDGAARTEQGDLEMALQFPDKMMKVIKMNSADGRGTNTQMDIVVVRGTEPGTAEFEVRELGANAAPGEKKVFIRKEGGDVQEVKSDTTQVFTMKSSEGGTWTGNVGDKNVVFEKAIGGGHAGIPRHDGGLLRTALSLLLTAPQGMDVAYLFGGESTVDGTVCNIVEARMGENVIKLYLGKESNLPVMMSYRDAKPMIIRTHKEDGAGHGEKLAGVEKDVKIFTRTSATASEQVEYQVKFTDYRTVGGVSLPHKWTQTVGGNSDETIDITGYEINPANIGDRFKAGEHKVFVRKAKDQ